MPNSLPDPDTPAHAAQTPPLGQNGPYHGPDRRTHVEPDLTKPGTAVSNALAVGTAAGAAAGSAVREFGSMGLKGWSSLVGNATGMMLVAFFALFLYRDFRAEVRESRDYQRDEMRVLRDEMGRQRDHDAAQREATRAEYRNSSAALFQATGELRLTRESLDRLVKEIRAANGGPRD